MKYLIKIKSKRKKRKEEKKRKKEELIFYYRSLQAVYSISSIFAHSLYVRRKFVHAKLFTDFGYRLTDAQTDRRTDRHDVTLEATPS